MLKSGSIAPRRASTISSNAPAVLARSSLRSTTPPRTATLREVGGMREDLHYVMDWELYLRMVLRLRGRLRTAATATRATSRTSHP